MKNKELEEKCMKITKENNKQQIEGKPWNKGQGEQNKREETMGIENHQATDKGLQRVEEVSWEDIMERNNGAVNSTVRDGSPKLLEEIGQIENKEIR